MLACLPARLLACSPARLLACSPACLLAHHWHSPPQGAEPLLFLDYFATAALDVDVAAQVVEGVADGCVLADCALLGGETAEMPGMYQPGDYDVAGFCVGAVRRSMLLPRAWPADPRGALAVGDVALGLASSGVHSNGFSLVRAAVDRAGAAYGSPPPFGRAGGLGPYPDGTTLGDALLEPTRIYVKAGWREPV